MHEVGICVGEGHAGHPEKRALRPPGGVRGTRVIRRAEPLKYQSKPALKAWKPPRCRLPAAHGRRAPQAAPKLATAGSPDLSHFPHCAKKI